MDGVVGAARLLELLELDVVRNDDRGDTAFRHCDPHRFIDDVPGRVRVDERVDVLMGDILVQRHEIDFLLEEAAHGLTRRLADDRDDGLVIHLGVVEAVQ